MSDVHPIAKPTKPVKPPRELSRRTPLRKRNPERAAVLFARNFGEWSDEIRMMTCYGCGRVPTPKHPNEAAHTVARGMGGCGGDKRTLLPMCRRCHAAFDDYRLYRDDVLVTREEARDAALALWQSRGPREDV